MGEVTAEAEVVVAKMEASEAEGMMREAAAMQAAAMQDAVEAEAEEAEAVDISSGPVGTDQQPHRSVTKETPSAAANPDRPSDAHSSQSPQAASSPVMASAEPVASSSSSSGGGGGSGSGSSKVRRACPALGKGRCCLYSGHLGDCVKRCVQVVSHVPKGAKAEARAEAEARAARVHEAVGHLGDGVLCESSAYDPACTHMVVLDSLKVEKLLGALAAGIWLLRAEWVLDSADGGSWLPEGEYEIHADGDHATRPLGGGAKLWMGAPRHHRVERERTVHAGSLAGPLYVLSLDKRMRPEGPRLKRILRAGGGRVWHEEALPYQERGGDGGGEVIVIVPAEATVDDCPLMRHAAARGVACVPPDYVVQKLTHRVPRGVEAFRMSHEP